MKIKFHKLVSAFYVDPTKVRDHIIDELTAGDYSILEKTQTNVEFKRYILRPDSRSKAFKKMDGGLFEISPQEKTVSLYYYISPLLEIAFSIIVSIVAIVENYYPLFFIIGIIFMFGIRIMPLKLEAKDLMERVVGEKGL